MSLGNATKAADFSLSNTSSGAKGKAYQVIDPFCCRYTHVWMARTVHGVSKVSICVLIDDAVSNYPGLLIIVGQDKKVPAIW